MLPKDRGRDWSFAVAHQEGPKADYRTVKLGGGQEVFFTGVFTGSMVLLTLNFRPLASRTV